MLPDPPDWLEAEDIEVWHQEAPGLYACGLLTVADVRVFAAYCQAAGQLIRASLLLRELKQKNPAAEFLYTTTNGNTIQSPLIGTIRCARSDMARFAADLGMSASARSRINVERINKSQLVGEVTGPERFFA